MYIPRGSEATSNLTSFSNLSDITSAPVILYTDTLDDVPFLFSTNNTSEAGFGFTVNAVNSSEIPTFVAKDHTRSNQIQEAMYPQSFQGNDW